MEEIFFIPTENTGILSEDFKSSYNFGFYMRPFSNTGLTEPGASEIWSYEQFVYGISSNITQPDYDEISNVGGQVMEYTNENIISFYNQHTSV